MVLTVSLLLNHYLQYMENKNIEIYSTFFVPDKSTPMIGCVGVDGTDNVQLNNGKRLV